MIINMYCSTGCAVVIGSCSRIQLPCTTLGQSQCVLRQTYAEVEIQPVYRMQSLVGHVSWQPKMSSRCEMVAFFDNTISDISEISDRITALTHKQAIEMKKSPNFLKFINCPL